jgi:hypothetical protein
VLKALDGLAQAIGVHSTNMVDTLAADQSAPFDHHAGRFRAQG